MMSFVIPRVFLELPQKIFHAVRLESRDRLQEILFRLPGLCLVDVCLTAGAGEPVLRVLREVSPAVVALEGGVVEAELCGVLAPLTATLKQPAGLEVLLSLVAAEQNVGVIPAQLLPRLDVPHRHKGDLLGRAGGDGSVGEAGVGQQGHLGVEIAGPGSPGDMAHTVGLQDPVGMLYILPRHPVQPQPGPDEGCDVPEMVRTPLSSPSLQSLLSKLPD